MLGVLRTDPDMPATIRDLHASRMLYALVDRVDEGDNPRQLIELFGGGSDAGAKTLVRPAVSMYRIYLIWYFDLSHELQNGFRRLAPDSRRRLQHGAFMPPSFLRARPDAPFRRRRFGSQSGDPVHTIIGPSVDGGGHDATWLDIPTRFLAVCRLIWRHCRRPSADSRRHCCFNNPSFPSCRIPTVHGYLARADVMRLAADRHNLHPAPLAAFILAEQRDQSRNEDAKDLTAATSLMQANTSIGPRPSGRFHRQRRGILFRICCRRPFDHPLNHTCIAMLLASDEFNIFAVAKYIRLVANCAAGAPSPATEDQTRLSWNQPGGVRRQLPYLAGRQHPGAGFRVHLRALG